MKRALLDKLDETHKFGAPPTLVEEEFNLMWNWIKADMESTARHLPTRTRPRKKAKKEYHKIADRRVRLGLVLSEIGEKNKITVTDDEVSRALIERARSDAGPREGSVGLLPQQSAGARPASRADL